MFRSTRTLVALALLAISTAALGATIPIANNARFTVTVTISGATMRVLKTQDLAAGGQLDFEATADSIYYVVFRPSTGGTGTLAGIYNATSATYDGNAINVTAAGHLPLTGCYSGQVIAMATGNAIASQGQLYLLAGDIPPKGHPACVCGTLYTSTGALPLVLVTSKCPS